MKLPHFLPALALLALTACSTTPAARRAAASPTGDTPETVMVTYHVQPGREADFPALLARAWEIYRQEHLVQAGPHVIVQNREPDGKACFVEIFTWVSHAAPAHAPAAVPAIWNEETAACEARNGHPALEGGEVRLISP